MKISETLCNSCVELNLTLNDKFDVIKHFMNQLAVINDLNDKTKEVITNEIISRENLMSTGLQNGIAIPHCSTEHTKVPMTFIGVSKNGIDFQSVDGYATNIIVMLVVPKSHLNEHVKRLAVIARLLNQKAIRQKIISAASTEEIIEIFKKAEE